MIRWLLAAVGLPAWTIYAVAALALSGALGGAYIKGRLDSSALCREAELRAEIVSLKRDISMQQAADMVEGRLMDDLARKSEEDQQRIEAYEKELASRPDARCSLTPDDVDRVRGKAKP